MPLKIEQRREYNYIKLRIEKMLKMPTINKTSKLI